MNNKKGFTLVELLVVIALIGLLIAIAVPSGLTISKKIKEKMLDTKIETIESGAIVWGQKNKNEIKTSSTACTKNTGSDYCTKKTIYTMLNEENAFEADGVDETTGKKYLKNPITDKSINACEVEIFIKNKRVYADYIETDVETTKCYYNVS